MIDNLADYLIFKKNSLFKDKIYPFETFMTNATSRHYTYTHQISPTKIDLPCDKNASHGDHWAILTNNIATDVPTWLQHMVSSASLAVGLGSNTTNNQKLLLASDSPCHIKQILTMQDGKPQALINAFPCIESPFTIACQVERIIRCRDTFDAILRLKTSDGTIIYAFDQLYAINHKEYETTTKYQAHLSAWAYNIEPSDQTETILVDDPKAIRYHRAFNDIVYTNNGQIPDDIEMQIHQWQPSTDTELAPVEINLGHSCIYLFGETFGQEDEAWCQGQVLGISHTQFFNQNISLFDVVILREHNTNPMVVRIATPTTDNTKKIAVHDYIQANIWLQVAIYNKD